MTESQTLFLVLAAIYVLECAVWVRRDAFVFRASRRGACRAFGGNDLPGITSRGLLLADLLPSLRSVFVCHPWPVSVSPEGVCAWVATTFNPGPPHPQAGTWIPFGAMGQVRAEEKRVFVGGRPFLAAATPGTARRIAEVLESLRSLPPERRASAIEAAIEKTLDVEAAGCVEAFWQRTRILHGACAALFLHLFALAPALVAWRGIRATWPWLLAGLLALTLFVTAEFVRVHRAIRPLDRGGLWIHAIALFLAPPAAIRSPDLLSRHLLEGVHPIAAARVLCPPEVFQDLLARALRDLRHPCAPAAPEEDPAAAEAVRWFRERHRRALERFASRWAASPGEMLGRPRRESATCRSYCPRCLLQYTATGGTCSDCGGIPLESLA